MDEFELIRRFFSAQPVQREDVLLGIGDDAALLHVPAAQELVVSTDTLVAGMHDARSESTCLQAPVCYRSGSSKRDSM